VNGRLFLARCCRSPLFWILCAATLLRLAAIAWGLPASDGWDDDGIAPRNFLVGIAKTYAGGGYFTYPPLQMILLALLASPGLIAALLQAPSLAPHDVIAAFIQVPYMTFFAATARLVSVAMSVGTVFLIGKIAELIGGRRAGWCAAAVCTLNAALTYYGQVTNLDGPYLFWSALSLWGWMRLMAEHQPRHIRWAALAAAAAIATKDQAYAVFLLSVPLALALWPVVDRWPRQNARRLIGQLLLWSGVALLALLAIDGAIGNPTGFMARIAFLTGPASQDYVQYQSNWSGRLRLLLDGWGYASRYYPPVAVVLGLFGIAMHISRTRDNGARLAAGLLPLLAIVSFTLAFNFVALRSEPRFILPQSVFLAVYIGLAAGRLAFAPSLPVKYVGRVLLSVIGVCAFYQCAGIDAAFLRDPRYDAERWLAAKVRPGDAIETYGLNVYLPRFPRDAVVTRLDRKPLKARNPLPHVRESDQPFADVAARQPQYLVVSGFWVREYLGQEAGAAQGGRIVQKVQRSTQQETGGRNYFKALFAGQLSYRLAHTSAYAPGIWPAVTAYESLAQTIFIFERIPAAAISRPRKP
jgi:4-amino-4-deoxy-L-arabinose transferase-like glycosyltransferase